VLKGYGKLGDACELWVGQAKEGLNEPGGKEFDEFEKRFYIVVEQ
jgi:hypothetical protein